jgi:hypothetical protein
MCSPPVGAWHIVAEVSRSASATGTPWEPTTSLPAPRSPKRFSFASQTLLLCLPDGTSTVYLGRCRSARGAGLHLCSASRIPAFGAPITASISPPSIVRDGGPHLNAAKGPDSAYAHVKIALDRPCARRRLARGTFGPRFAVLQAPREHRGSRTAEIVRCLSRSQAF